MVGLEGTSKPIRFQPLLWACCPPTAQAAQGPIHGTSPGMGLPQLWAAVPALHLPLKVCEAGGKAVSPSLFQPTHLQGANGKA